ncbi:hypothetical protein BLNAU_9786 [Blattamonas nauphoetae]|uniref:Uncharacterized protein n=1 Tax=Blattamonas nauphoetae TaxID=2049346 RepID=A0ABQ9XUT5_9EUKA|nr:hypothetical protein BLNAU_9786 [Blattamonas nauphoetae]
MRHIDRYLAILLNMKVCPIHGFFRIVGDRVGRKSGCAKGGGGDGFGIAFFIILLASAVLYFAIGIPICKCGMKKSGKEIIPFVNFWIALPGLFVEGVKCMFSPCCKKKGYDAVS